MMVCLWLKVLDCVKISMPFKVVKFVILSQKKKFVIFFEIVKYKFPKLETWLELGPSHPFLCFKHVPKWDSNQGFE